MRRLSLLLPLLLALPLAGCNAVQPVGTVSRAEAMAPAAAAPCSRAAAPVDAAVQPAYAYGIGPDDQVRSMLVVPTGVLLCLVQGLQCALSSLVPTVQPTLHPVTTAPAPRAAAPCAPAPAAAIVPCPVAAPLAAPRCPPPPPAPPVASLTCTDPSCGLDGAK